MTQALRTCEEALSLGVVAHRRTAAGWRPHGSNEGTDHEVPRSNAIGQSLQVVIARIDADVRLGQEKVDTLEPDPINQGLRRQIKHRVELDRRLGAGALAHEPWPHGVVERGMFGRADCARHFCISLGPHFLGRFRNDSASGLPGPKCFNMTSGSVAL